MKKTKVLLASAGMLLTSLIWGFAFVVVKNSLDTLPPVYILAFRFTIATLALSAIFFKKLKNIKPSAIIKGIILGVFIYLGYLLQTIGCIYTTAGKNAFLTAVYVVAVPFLHWAINKTKTKMTHVTAAILAITGIGLLSLQNDLSVNIGDLLSLLCGLAFGLHIVFIERYTKSEDPVVLTILQLATAAVISCITAPIIDGGFPAEAFRGDIIISMLYLGLLSTMAAFLLQNVGQKYVPPSAASILLSTESVFGVTFSAIFLKEKLTLRMLAGCALILAAIILSEIDLEKLPNRFKPNFTYDVNNHDN